MKTPVKNELKNLRVLVLATTFPRWDNDQEPRFIFELSKRLAKNVSLCVLVPHAPGAKLREEIDGVKIIRFPYFIPTSSQTLCYEGGILPKLKQSWLARLQLPFFLIAQFLFIFRTAAKFQANLIHCHWIIPQGFFTFLYSRWARVPYLLTAHGGDVYAFKNNSLILTFSRFALKHCRTCTTNSQATSEAVKNIWKKTPVETIPMGVDTEKFSPEQHNPSLKNELGIRGMFLLGVGRFAEKKGFTYLITALPTILQEYPDTVLVLVGFGPQEKELKQQVRDLGIESSTRFPGSKSGKELAEYFASADMFVGPSVVAQSGDTEGQGVVFLEAMASGTPVIASDVGGITDVVQNGKTGMIIPQRNSAAIAETVLALWNDSNLRSSLIANGTALVKKSFSWDSIAERFLATYSKITEPHND